MQTVTRETITETLIRSYGTPEATIAALLEENARLSSFIRKSVSFGYAHGQRETVARLIEWE